MKRIVMLFMALTLILSSVVAFAETDEPSGWAVESINQLRETKYFREEAFKNYKNDITRKEFIYLAVRVYEVVNGEITADPSIKFSDTDDIYALKGATVGITTGIGNGKFGPDILLTREQLAVLMVNTLELANLEVKASDGYTFVDEGDFSSWAKDKIYIAKANGIINGVGNDTFNSQGQASIEQALIITNKILVAYPDSRAGGKLAHIIDITKAGNSDEILKPGDYDFQEDTKIQEIMSKYGTTPDDVDGSNYQMGVHANGFDYAENTFDGQTFADVTVNVVDNNVKISIRNYNDKIKAMVVDFMDYAFASDNGHADVMNKVFSDFENTKVKVIGSDDYSYATGSLIGKSFDIGNVNVEYKSTTGSFIIYLTIN